MRVILEKDIHGLGKKFEVKEVKDGHARNFLLPRKLAIAATPQALAALRARMTQNEKAALTTRVHLEALRRRIDGTVLMISIKANDEGKIFGSVSNETILSALRDARLITTERIHTKIAHPLKEVGDHPVAVDLGYGIAATITVALRRQL